jgi:hypothetical protein
MEAQKILNRQSNPEPKQQCWSYHNIWLQITLQSHSNTTAWYWHKNRHKEQWNRIKDPDTNPCNYSHMIFDKGSQNMCWRKDRLFNKWCWKNWISTCRRLKLEPCLSPYKAINNVRSETVKLIQEKNKEYIGPHRHR